MNRNKRLVKNTLILGIGQLIPKLLGIVVLPLLTDGLSTDEYGIYDLIISISSLSLPLMSFLVQQGSFRFLITTKDENCKKRIITTTYAFTFLLIVSWNAIVLPVLWIKVGNIAPLIMLLYASEVLYDVSGQICRGLGRNIFYSVGVIIYSSLNLILLLAFTYQQIFDLNYVLLSSVIAYITGFIVLIALTKTRHYFSFSSYSKDTLRDLLSYSVPIVPSSISLWIVNLSDRLIVIAILGPSANGIYGVANKIPHLVGSAYSVFNLAWTESATRAVNDADKEEYYSRLYHVLFDLLTCMVLIIVACSSLMFSILIDERYHEGYNQMPILCMGVFYSCLVSYYGGIYVALKKTKEVGLSSIVGAIINVLINVVFINFIGLFAASISTLISYLSIFLYRKYNLKKHIRLSYNNGQLIRNYALIGLTLPLFYINTFATQIILYCLAFIFSIYVIKVHFIELIRKKRRV